MSSNGSGRRLAIGLGLLILATLPYLQVAQHEFVHFDDDVYVFENPRIAQGLGWDAARWALATVHAGNWHPLTWLSHMLDVQLYGLDPSGHHATSVALHALNTVLLALALLAMTGAPWRSGLVAALFAVHPLRVESVAWVAERKDVLCGLFWMLGLLAYAWYARRPRIGRYLLVFAALVLGLMAKPMAVTLPLVFLLLDLWPLRRMRSSWLVVEKLPLLALAAASSVATLIAQSAGGAVGSLDRLPLHLRLANAAVAYALYLWKSVWPFELAVFYPHPATLPSFASSRFAVAAIAAAIGLAAVTVLVLRASPRRPYLLVGWLWYLGTLVPVIGVFQVGLQSMADRYVYLPLVGIQIMAVWGGAELAARLPRGRVVAGVVAALVLASSTASSWMQARVWRDSRTLFEHAVSVTRDNYAMHNNLGNVYARAGDLDRATAELEESLRIKPDYARAHNNLGVVWERRRDWQRAARSYERAVELDPAYATAFHNLGNARQLLGDPGGAASAYRRAVEIDPGYTGAHGQLGSLYAQTGDLAQARTHLERVLQIDPSQAAVYNNLGVVLREQGDLAGAQAQLLEAIRRQPDYPEALNNLGIVHAMQGDLERAAEQFTRALALDPTHAAARDNLARARGQRGPAGVGD